jgi:hypothetical protein
VNVRLEWGEAHTETSLQTEGMTLKTEGNVRPKRCKPLTNCNFRLLQPYELVARFLIVVKCSQESTVLKCI